MNSPILERLPSIDISGNPSGKQIRKPQLSAPKKLLRGNNRQNYSGSGCQEYSVKGIRLCTCRIIGGFTGIEMAPDVWLIYQVVCENNRKPVNEKTTCLSFGEFSLFSYFLACQIFDALMTNASFATTHSLIARNTRLARHWCCHLPAVGGYILFYPIAFQYFC